MLKLTTVFLFVIMSITGTMHGQTLSKPPEINAPQTDLRQVISKETEKIKNESATIDAKKMEKSRRQVPKKNWSGKKTALVILAIVGIAALVFILVKYYKKCLRYEPEGCSITYDDYCTCAEYEQEDTEDRSRRLR